ncbi:hypothetical protein ACS0TY_030211 [Phlomoides rotata]
MVSLIWDGKIEIFPSHNKNQQEKISKNSIRGTLVTKPIDNITKEVIKDCILHQMTYTTDILSDYTNINAKWPASACKNIFIQQANEKSHINNNNRKSRATPSNSPGTNINDIGYFGEIQSLQVNTTLFNNSSTLYDVIE